MTLRPLATRPIKKRTQISLRDTLQTGLAYIHSELVETARTNAKEGEKRAREMLEISRRPTDGLIGTKDSKAQSKNIADKRDALPVAGWVRRTAEVMATASERARMRQRMDARGTRFNLGAVAHRQKSGHAATATD
ncbi:hypothetical protein BJ912DRAFT_1147751 [Pholiota molesta]|nr:hypothetical protein BJ912DRAFT_1147751 [Pholiota molesta]